MKTADYIIIAVLFILKALAFTYILKRRKAGKCVGCSGCDNVTKVGCKRKPADKKTIEKLLKTKVGVCSFVLFSDKLINCKKKNEIPDNAKSIIMFAFPYKVKEEPPENISRYSAVKDYHIVVGEILNGYTKRLKAKFPGYDFVYFSDNSPIPEVPAAAVSGLGVSGKNGLLITEKYGSFVFLGEIVTDMYITPEENGKRCIGCNLCEAVCPVGLNKQNCLSSLTQKKGELTKEEKDTLKKYGLIWGCDICQNVCPMNKGKAKTNIKQFLNSYRGKYLPGEDITDRAYTWRGEDVILRNSENLKKK